jgi:leader peptidase (prepilin peptidase)/N-methyltransferase
MSPTLAELGVFAVAVTAVFGLMIGSFLNVVVYRVPNGMSLVRPPSACPHCRNQIKPYDNIPLISWLVLRGACRRCKEPISARYPLVEAGTAIFFGVVAAVLPISFGWQTGGSALVADIVQTIAFLYLVAITVALALIDLDTHTLPNQIVLPGYFAAGALFATASVLQSDYSALLRAGIAGVGLFAFYFLLALVRPGGMGFGDVKLAGVIGIYLGWTGWGALAVGGLAAFVLGGVYGVALMLGRRAHGKSGIPFGPWMLAGAWIGVFFGDLLWSGYLSILGMGK